MKQKENVNDGKSRSYKFGFYAGRVAKILLFFAIIVCVVLFALKR